MSDKSLIRIDRLRELINGIPARQYIADEIGCDVSLITKHFNGQRAVTMEYLVKYANYFGVSTDYLLGLTDVAATDTEIKSICEYTGLSETAVSTLHGRLDKLLSENELISEEAQGILTTKDIEKYKQIISDFISSYTFKQIIDCFYDEAFTKTNAYNKGLKIAGGDLSEFIDVCKSDLLQGYFYWLDLVNSFHDNKLYNEHRLNLFNAQEYILSYAKSLTDFDNLQISMLTLENILLQTNLKLNEYVHYMGSSYPEELWQNDDEFINELCNEMKKAINIESERTNKMIDAVIIEG